LSNNANGEALLALVSLCIFLLLVCAAGNDLKQNQLTYHNTQKEGTYTMTDENLTPFPTNWVTDNPWGTDVPGLNVFRDTTITHEGAYTLRVEPSVTYPTNTGMDYYIVPVSVGDLIRMQCWIKTGGSTPILYAGARIGLDFYDAQIHRISAANCLNDAISGDYRTSTSAQIDAAYVHWGSDWTLMEWEFYVPGTVVADQTSAYYNVNQLGVPAYIIPWCQIWIAAGQSFPNDAHEAYFSDFQFYVNPESEPPSSSMGVAVAVMNMMRRR
jgi:hypothetical protein